MNSLRHRLFKYVETQHDDESNHVFMLLSKRFGGVVDVEYMMGADDALCCEPPNIEIPKHTYIIKSKCLSLVVWSKFAYISRIEIIHLHANPLEGMMRYTTSAI